MVRRWLCPAAILLALAASGSAAVPRPPARAGDTATQPLFSARAELVVLHVTVKDARGAYVSGLPATAFRVLDDSRPQPVQFFTAQDAPATIGLIVDSSGSMQPNRARVLAAAAAFTETSNPGDEIFALAFNERVWHALPARAPFTSDAATLHDALDRIIAASGRTALYDAVAAGLDYLARGTRERQVMVIVSDGGDNASRTTLDDLVARMQASNVLVYTVAIVDPVGREANPRILRRLAQESGGEAFEPRDPGRVIDVLRHIARDIRTSYTLAYAPREAGPQPTFRRIRVIVSAPDGRRVVVRTRTGYLSAAVAKGGAP